MEETGQDQGETAYKVNDKQLDFFFICDATVSSGCFVIGSVMS